jgi:hypothetical protein
VDPNQVNQPAAPVQAEPQYAPAEPVPVVQSVQMPKINVSQGAATGLSAFAVTFAIFFGIASVFGAIAAFTKGEWEFSIPVINNIPVLSSLLLPGSIPTLFITAFLAILLGVVGFLSMRKITSTESLAKPYSATASVFLVLGMIFAAVALATAFYGLFGLGKASGVSQKPLWLNLFLPYLVYAITSIGIGIMSKKVAAGNTATLRLLGLVGMGVAGLGVLLVSISTLVNFYSDGSSSSKSKNEVCYGGYCIDVNDYR